MSSVDLGLQLKFLNELEDALQDALKRYSDDSPEKLAELNYMKSEVLRARRVVSERMAIEAVDSRQGQRGNKADSNRHQDLQTATFEQAVFS